MKNQNPLLWGFTSLIIGLLLIVYPSGAIELMLRVIGIVLAAVGVVQLVSFLAARKRTGLRWLDVPLGGVLGVILGVMLLSAPALFVSFFMYMVGVAFLVISVIQVVSLSSVRKTKPDMPIVFFLFPVLMFLAGFVFFFFPMSSAAWIVIFAGAWIMAYGISRIVGYFMLRK